MDKWQERERERDRDRDSDSDSDSEATATETETETETEKEKEGERLMYSTYRCAPLCMRVCALHYMHASVMLQHADVYIYTHTQVPTCNAGRQAGRHTCIHIMQAYTLHTGINACMQLMRMHQRAQHSRLCRHKLACTYARIHVCMYACMYAHMHVCMYGCMDACMYVWMYGCMDVRTYVCMCACMYA